VSGHSKWSTIKRKKAAADAKRGQVFTRLAKEIALVAREGADPDMNFKLRLVIDKAKAENMPKENIERAIRRGAGLDKDAAILEEVTYEGYGPHGVAYLVQVVTDNRNRAVAEVRYWFNKAGGSLGEVGCVAWLFEQKGYITVEPDGHNQEELFDLAVEAGAEDVTLGGDLVEIFTDPTDLYEVRRALEGMGVEIDDAELSMMPKTTVNLGVKEAFQNMNLINHLEEAEDVQNVYTNLDITDELMARFEEEES
jgi:YebC/PmpR family DNA-binding regulatory protein